MLLVSSAGASRSAADNLAAIVDISSKTSYILVINKSYFIFAEMTYFSMSAVSFVEFSHFYIFLRISLQKVPIRMERHHHRLLG